MAIGDSNDVLTRLRLLMPPWFPQQGSAPVIDGVLTGVAAGFSFIYSLIAFARLQMRLATAQGGWLDLFAWDYLGGRYVRKIAELDAIWQSRISREILRERNTRNGLKQVLLDLTGMTPAVFEPSAGMDTGGYGVPGLLAYGVNGAYGSMLTPWQGFVGAFRPSQSGIPNVGGYGSPSGGYGQPSQARYNTLSQIVGAVTDADIIAAVDAVRPATVLLTTGISNFVTQLPITDENGIGITDEAGNQLFQD